jgi:hypothetical protein
VDIISVRAKSANFSHVGPSRQLGRCSGLLELGAKPTCLRHTPAHRCFEDGAEADPLPEEPEQSAREAMASMPAAPTSDAKKEPPARKRAEVPPQAKRWTRRPAEPRLAFDRHDFFTGGWW